MFGLSTLQLKIAGAVFAGSLLLGTFMWYGAKREAQGFASGNRAQLETDKQQFEQVRKQYRDALQSREQEIQAANSRISSLETQIQSLSAQFSALATLRQQQANRVNALSDTEIKADLELQLGGPLENPAVLRKADNIVTQYPTVVKQLDVLNSKVDKLTDELSETNKKIEAITAQRDTAIKFGDQVVGYYTKAYNAAQKKHSTFIKIITFGLVKDRHLDLPSPTTLTKPN